MSRLDAPYGTHAERLDRLMLFVDSYCSPDELLSVMAACIREQQAALQLLVNSCDTQIRNKDGEQMGVRTPDRLTVAQARAVLAKYALEVKP